MKKTILTILTFTLFQLQIIYNQESNLMEHDKILLDDVTWGSRIDLDLGFLEPQIKLDNGLTYNSTVNRHRRALLSGVGLTGKLKLIHYENDLNQHEDANNTAVPNSFPYDMIELQQLSYGSSEMPQFHFGWNIGLMNNVELSGGIGGLDDWDCRNCLTYAFSYSGLSTYIRRVIDEDGEDYYMSDRRMKENVQDLGDGLNIIKALKPKSYNYLRSNRELEDSRKFGLIAQDIKDILPELVVKVKQPESELETYMLNYDGLIPILIKSIQQQQEYIEKIEKRISQLEQKED